MHKPQTERESLGAEYEEVVGYNPFEDDPTLSEIEVRDTLEQIKIYHATDGTHPDLKEAE